MKRWEPTLPEDCQVTVTYDPVRCETLVHGEVVTPNRTFAAASIATDIRLAAERAPRVLAGALLHLARRFNRGAVAVFERPR